jgi:hypothetical protein
VPSAWSCRTAASARCERSAEVELFFVFKTKIIVIVWQAEHAPERGGSQFPLAGLICAERPGEFSLLTEDGELPSYRVG